MLSAANVTQLPVRRRVRASDRPASDTTELTDALHRATRAADADGYLRGLLAGRSQGLRLGTLLGLAVALAGAALAHIVASGWWA